MNSMTNSTTTNSTTLTHATSREISSKLSTVLRHPRSLVRLNPEWTAPTISVEGSHAPLRLSVSRHRITSRMWTRLSKHIPPEGQDRFFLVQLKATCSPSSISSCPADVTDEVRDIFEDVAGDSWHIEDNFNPHNDEGDLQWTWYMLFTQADLENQPHARQQAA